MDIKEIIARIESEYEVNFAWDDWLKQYTAKVSRPKATFSLNVSHYNTGDERQGQRFIGVSYQEFGGSYYGYGAPCDTYEEIIARVKKHFEPRAQMSLFDFI